MKILSLTELTNSVASSGGFFLLLARTCHVDFTYPVASYGSRRMKFTY